MSKYGEPFGFGSREIDALVDCSGFVVGRPCREPEWHYRVYWNEDTWRRIFACVNALAGVENPEEFVRAAKEMRHWQEQSPVCTCGHCDICVARRDFDAAIGGTE